MIKEIVYNNDVITIDTNRNTFSSKENIKYEIINSPTDNSIQFLTPPNQENITINAETGEVVELGNEDTIEF